MLQPLQYQAFLGKMGTSLLRERLYIILYSSAKSQQRASKLTPLRVSVPIEIGLIVRT